jgi:hypothetical protein
MTIGSMPGVAIPGAAIPGAVSAITARDITVVFRRTLSELGTRPGARQMVKS